MTTPPKHLDLRREEGLQIEWADGSSIFYSVKYLRRMSPSADSKALREELDQNPLAILPTTSRSKLTIVTAELVGNYAIRFTFSDGHTAGIYSWDYLDSLKPPNND